MGRIILVEGLDLAGKSTLVARLRESLEATGFSLRGSNGELCPQNPTARVAREMVRWDEGFGGLEAGALFLSAQMWDARHFRPPSSGQIHLQDSSWLRSLAFERVLGSPIVAQMMEEQAKNLPAFDQALILTASLETRARRLKQREKNDLHDLFAFRKPDLFLAIERELVRLAQLKAGAQVLVTDELDQEQVLERAQALLSRPRAAA